MSIINDLQVGERALYSNKYFSGNYNHDIFLKHVVCDDGSTLPKYYIAAYCTINNRLTQLGYLYFYLDLQNKNSFFIGMQVEPEYRNMNLGSFLIACWIDLCLNNGYNFLGVNPKQRKPFLLYLLKTYGFEILDITQYFLRLDVISICRSINPLDNRKLLLFRDAKHESNFRKTNIFKTDNYEIIHNKDDIILLDDIILPLQNMRKNHVDYELLYPDIAQKKVTRVLSNHKR